MKLALLSDTRLPTAWAFAGHGLGKAVLAAADALVALGHEVTLFGHPQSQWDGDDVVAAAHERDYQDMSWGGYDAILDSTHGHELARRFRKLPIVNWSHDREAHPGARAVYPSRAHQTWHGGGGRVVLNGIPTPQLPAYPKHDYLLFLGTMYAPKAPVWAVQVAREVGMPLVMAGPTPPMHPTGDGVQYVGPVTGDDKWELLGRARALLFLATTEAGALTPLEAQWAGTPVMVSAWGAAREQIVEDVTGVVVRTTGQAVAHMDALLALSTSDCKEYVGLHRTSKRMAAGLAAVLTDAAEGEVW